MMELFEPGKPRNPGRAWLETVRTAVSRITPEKHDAIIDQVRRELVAFIETEWLPRATRKGEGK